MDKASLFLTAMNHGLYKKKAWVIRAFSLTKEDANAYLSDPYPYRIVALPNGYHYVDPANDNQLTMIDDATISEPLYKFRDVIHIPAGVVPTVMEPIDTLYGNVLVNYVGILGPLNGKIPFLVGKITARGIEALILPRLVDDPDESGVTLSVKQIDPDPFKQPIYVSERIRQANAMFYLTGFTQIATPSATEKTMVAPLGIIELRNKLLEQYKDQLHEPAIIARISDELVQYIKDDLKGDRGADFLIDEKKAYGVVRSKRFGLLGAQKSLQGTSDFNVVTSSLDEGWDLNSFTLMNNTSRAGSYDRGAETQLGGESVKWLLRASSNINILINEDCGTTVGMPQLITNDRHNTVGFHVVSEKGPVEITNENYDEYLGKRVMIRSPMFCKSKLTDYCHICMGPRLSSSPTGASNAISQYGNEFMALSLKGMHGKALKVVKIDLKDVLS